MKTTSGSILMTAIGLLLLRLMPAQSHVIYYTRELDTNLYKIDTNAEIPTETIVGDTGVEFRGLEMAPDGTLYGISSGLDGPSSLYTIDPYTAVPTPIGTPFFEGFHEHIAVDTNGDILLLDGGALYELNKTNASPTFVRNVTGSPPSLVRGASVTPLNVTINGTEYDARNIFAVGDLMAYVISRATGTVLDTFSFLNDKYNETVTFCGDGSFYGFDSTELAEIDLEQLAPLNTFDTSDNVMASACSGLTCPPNMVGICGQDVFYALPAWNPSSGATIEQIDGLASGSVFPVGTTTNTFQVSTTSGNMYECSFIVTVVDDQEPVCPADVVLDNDAGSCGANVTYEFQDNCAVSSIEQFDGLASGSMFPVGTTMNIIQVTDEANNTKECSFNVTVVDVEDPVITCVTDMTTANDPGQCGAMVSYTSPVGMDNCLGATTELMSGLGSGGSFPVGTTTETYKVTDASGNEASCSFAVMVTDNEAPQLYCPRDRTMDSTEGMCGAIVDFDGFVDGGDNCDEHFPEIIAGRDSGTLFPVGTTTQTYRAMDESGNSVECNFTITVVSNEEPLSLVCPEDITVESDEGMCGAFVDYTAPESVMTCAGNTSTALIAGRQSGAFFPVGTTTQTYHATSASGSNLTECNFDVTVVDSEPLDISKFSCGEPEFVLEAATDLPIDYLPWYTKSNGCNVTLEVSNASCNVCNNVNVNGNDEPVERHLVVDNIFGKAQEGNSSTCNISMSNGNSPSIQIGDGIDNAMDEDYTITWSNAVCDSNGCENYMCSVCMKTSAECEGGGSGKGKGGGKGGQERAGGKGGGKGGRGRAGGKGGGKGRSHRHLSSSDSTSTGKGHTTKGDNCGTGKGKGGKGGKGGGGKGSSSSSGSRRLRVRRLQQSDTLFVCPADWDPTVDELQCL